MECNYCNRTFSSKYTLKTHQQTAKYCSKNRVNNDTNKSYKCECDNVYTVKHNLILHKKTCKMSTILLELNDFKVKYNAEILQKNKLEKVDEKNDKIYNQMKIDLKLETDRYKIAHIEIKRLHEEIHILQDKLENISIEGVKKHTTTNVNTVNNIIQNLDHITPELLEEQSQNIDLLSLNMF
jgi:hypothetical protein